MRGLELLGSSKSVLKKAPPGKTPSQGLVGWSALASGNVTVTRSTWYTPTGVCGLPERSQPRWPELQVLFTSCCCFCFVFFTAHELSMIFIYFPMVEKKKKHKRKILWPMKMTWDSIRVSINTVLLKYSHAHPFMCGPWLCSCYKGRNLMAHKAKNINADHLMRMFHDFCSGPRTWPAVQNADGSVREQCSFL